jgi:hypothetical protein
MCTDQGASPEERKHRSEQFNAVQGAGPGLVIFQRVRCTTGDCRPRQATGPLHSLWRAAA